MQEAILRVNLFIPGTDPRIFRAMEQCPRMAACVMHWYSAVSSAALCLQANLTALYLLCREQQNIQCATE